MHKLFVYGTLKRGEQAHHLLHGSTYLGTARTLEKYVLYELCIEGFRFPALSDRERLYYVYGELYEVDDRILEALDRHEGIPLYYERKVIPVVLMDREEVVYAYTYIAKEYLLTKYEAKKLFIGIWSSRTKGSSHSF